MNRTISRNRISTGNLADADTLDTALITAVSKMVSTKGNPSKNPSGYSSSGKLDTQIPSLLSAGANPDCRDDRGRPALVAALDGSVAGPEILRQLLAAGASPDLATISTDSSKGDRSGKGGVSVGGLTALHCAARRGYQVCVNLLLSAGADVNLADSRGNTTLMKASKAGHSPTVNTLLQQGADVTSVNSNRQTALHAASQRPGNTEVICLLLDYGAPLNATDVDGQTALVYAARDRHTDIVELLLDVLVDKDYYVENSTYWLNSADKQTGKTALHYSVECAHVKGVQLLIDRGANMNVKDAAWRTPFFYALSGSDLTLTTSKRTSEAVSSDIDIILRELIEAGCDLVGTDRTFNTTLHSAAKRGLTEVVELIAQTGISIDVKGGKDGITSLMVAAQGGHASTVHCLLELGANPDSVDRHNASSLVYAILSRSSRWSDKRTVGSSTHLGPSAYSGQNAIMDIVKALLRFNCNADLACNLSSWNGSDIGGKLLDFEIDNEKMYSPLELTFLIGKPDLFLLLVKSGCYLNGFEMDTIVNEYEQYNNNKQVGCMDETTLRYLHETIRTYRANIAPLAELCRRPALTYIARMTSLADIKSLDLISLVPKYTDSLFFSSGGVHDTEEQMESLQEQVKHTLMFLKLDETSRSKPGVTPRKSERLKSKVNKQKYRSDGKLVKINVPVSLNSFENEKNNSTSTGTANVNTQECMDVGFISPALTLSDSVFDDKAWLI